MQVFTNNPKESISILREQELLRCLRKWYGDAVPPPPFGMGDDCAVLPNSSAPANLFKVDALVYGRHFDDSIPPAEAGAKLLKRNLSDIASMGGTPLSAVVSLFLSPQTSLDYLEVFIKGLAACAREYQVMLVGGDLTETPNFFGGSLALLGHAARPATRKGGEAGDWIAVTGPLGGSIRGHHYTFRPRMREGAWLAAQAEVRSMMDVTDGLAKDLPELLPDGYVAALDVPEIPITADAQVLSKTDGIALLDHALSDGEDYELVFTLAAGTDLKDFKKRYEAATAGQLYIIGKVAAQSGEQHERLLDSTSGNPLSARHGYEHFGKAR